VIYNKLYNSYNSNSILCFKNNFRSSYLLPYGAFADYMMSKFNNYNGPVPPNFRDDHAIKKKLLLKSYSDNYYTILV
jgi:hypothetical protein